MSACNKFCMITKVKVTFLRILYILTTRYRTGLNNDPSAARFFKIWLQKACLPKKLIFFHFEGKDLPKNWGEASWRKLRIRPYSLQR